MAGYGDIWREQNDPEGKSLWTILAGYGGNRNPDAETQRNIYSQGYLGEDISGGIKEPRSPIGSLLQSVGILGEPAPRPATPFERYLYTQGHEGKLKEDLNLGAAEFNLSNAKRARQLSDFTELLKTEGLGGGAPPALFGDMTPDEIASGEAVGSEAAKKRLEQQQHMQLTDKYLQAQIDYMNQGGKQKQVDMADEISKIYRNNKDLVDMIRAKTIGGGKSPVGSPYKGLHELTDLTEKQNRLDELKMLRRQLETRLASQGISGDQAGFVADALAGNQPNDFEQLLGLNAQMNKNPDQERKLESLLNQPSVTNAVKNIGNYLGFRK